MQNSLMLRCSYRMYNMFEIQANRFAFQSNVSGYTFDNVLYSAERIKDFLVIDQEPLSTEQGKPPAYWPSSGNIIADGLSAQYSKGAPIINS